MLKDAGSVQQWRGQRRCGEDCQRPDTQYLPGRLEPQLQQDRSDGPDKLVQITQEEREPSNLKGTLFLHFFLYEETFL